MNRADAIVEAQRRGLLPSREEAMAEAQRRGLLPPGEDPLAGLEPSEIQTQSGVTREALVQSGREATGEIDYGSNIAPNTTVAGLPINVPKEITRKVDYTPPVSPSFGTMYGGAVIDDPDTAIAHYSKKMGIPKEKFAISNGAIVFEGPEGIYYYASPPGAKRFAAEMTASAPEVVLGTAGAIFGGPAGAGVGAGTGELIRKGQAHYMYDEPWDTKETLKDVGISAAFGVGGEKFLGGGTIRGYDAMQGRQGARIMAAAGRGRERMSLPEMKRIEQLGKDFGVDLNIAQTTGSPELINKWKLLRDLGPTADVAGDFEKKQLGEVVDAVHGFLNAYKGQATPGSAGKKVQTAADKAIQAAKTVRANKASPHYRKAFESGAEVDIQPVVDLVDGKLAHAKGSIRSALQRAKKHLMRGGELDTSIEGLHQAKLEIDEMVEKAGKPGSPIGNTSKRNLKEVQKELLKQMDAASPDYAKARQVFGGESETYKGLAGKKRIIGELAQLEGDQVTDAARKIFDGRFSEQNIQRVKGVVTKYGGEDAWNEILGVHLASMVDQAAKTGGNYPFQVWKRMWRDPQHARMMKQSMTPRQHQNFENFMEVLHRSGLLGGGESRTIPAGEAMQEMKDTAKPLLVRALEASRGVDATRPGTWVPTQWAANKIMEVGYPKYYQQLMKAMNSPRAAKQVERMLLLSPGSQRLIRGVSTFLTLGVLQPLLRDSGEKFEGKPSQATEIGPIQPVRK